MVRVPPPYWYVTEGVGIFRSVELGKKDLRNVSVADLLRRSLTLTPRLLLLSLPVVVPAMLGLGWLSFAAVAVALPEPGGTGLDAASRVEIATALATSVMLFAATGVGKSQVAMSLALAVAGGRSAFGWQAPDPITGQLTRYPAEIFGPRALDRRRAPELVEQVAEAVDVGEARQVAQRHRLVRTLCDDPERQHHLIFVTKGDAAGAVRKFHRRGPEDFDGVDIVGFRKVDPRRDTGISRRAPVGLPAGGKLEFDRCHIPTVFHLISGP